MWRWVSALVIQETQHAPSVKAAAEPKEEQAASRPLAIRTEKAVRKSMAPPDSSEEVWMVWTRNATMLVLAEQGTWGRFSCYGQVESAEAAGAEHGLAE
jgi:hypothetical protein